jgi:TolB protein
MMRPVRLALLLALIVAPPLAAQTTEVRLDLKGGGQRIHIRTEPLSPLGDRAARDLSVQADDVLARDLAFSAVFTVDTPAMTSSSGDVQAIVGGTLSQKGNQLVLHGEAVDAASRKPIFTHDYPGPVTAWRSLVHRLADDLVMQFTGEPGVASTRIAFIGVGNGSKELYVMDSDGWYVKPLTHDRSIAQSPAWSPDGSLILFTSYRGDQGPRVYVTPSAGGPVYLVSGRPGLNTSASYSPDGREIACTLSQDGNAEVYRLDARGGDPHRLTSSRGIDTSPCWSPTGREVAFTSDRSGNPQVYVMDREGGNARRLTFDLTYTDSPAWSPKGDRIAFVARSSGGFDIYTCRPDGTDLRLEVTGGSNENPHWSPDGRHLVFASSRDGPFGVYVSDLDQGTPRRIDTGGLVATSPAWSPRFAEPLTSSAERH